MCSTSRFLRSRRPGSVTGQSRMWSHARVRAVRRRVSPASQPLPTSLLIRASTSESTRRWRKGSCDGPCPVRSRRTRQLTLGQPRQPLPVLMGGRCWISPSCAAGMRLRCPGTTGWCPGQRSAPARTTASRCLRSRRRLRSLRSRRPGTSFARRRWRWPRRRATPTALLLSSRRTRPCCTRYALAVLSKLELLG